MRISVAIATYNRAAMVREAVEAALAQSHAPYEIVVADDASTDETCQVLARLAAGDRRVRVIRQTANSGGVENWNAAMNVTRGDLLAWCSDDDRFWPGHLEASFKYLKAHPEVYGELEAKSAAIAGAAPAGVTVNRVGSMFTWFFTDQPVTDWDSAKRADTAKFAAFHRRMLEQGIYLPPSQFEAAFVSAAHTEADIRRTNAALSGAGS